MFSKEVLATGNLKGWMSATSRGEMQVNWYHGITRHRNKQLEGVNNEYIDNITTIIMTITIGLIMVVIFSPFAGREWMSPKMRCIQRNRPFYVWEFFLYAWWWACLQYYHCNITVLKLFISRSRVIAARLGVWSRFMLHSWVAISQKPKYPETFSRTNWIKPEAFSSSNRHRFISLPAKISQECKILAELVEKCIE